MNEECNVFTQTHDNCTSASVQYERSHIQVYRHVRTAEAWSHTHLGPSSGRQQVSELPLGPVLIGIWGQVYQVCLCLGLTNRQVNKFNYNSVCILVGNSELGTAS